MGLRRNEGEKGAGIVSNGCVLREYGTMIQKGKWEELRRTTISTAHDDYKIYYW